MSEITLVLAHIIYNLDFKDHSLEATHGMYSQFHLQSRQEPEFPLKGHVTSAKDGPYVQFRSALPHANL